MHHTFEAMEITYAPNESLPNSAAILNVSSTSLTSKETYKKIHKIKNRNMYRVNIYSDLK